MRGIGVLMIFSLSSCQRSAYFFRDCPLLIYVSAKNTQVSESKEFRCSYSLLGESRNEFKRVTNSVICYRGAVVAPRWKDVDTRQYLFNLNLRNITESEVHTALHNWSWSFSPASVTSIETLWERDILPPRVRHCPAVRFYRVKGYGRLEGECESPSMVLFHKSLLKKMLSGCWTTEWSEGYLRFRSHGRRLIQSQLCTYIQQRVSKPSLGCFKFVDEYNDLYICSSRSPLNITFQSMNEDNFEHIQRFTSELIIFTRPVWRYGLGVREVYSQILILHSYS